MTMTENVDQRTMSFAEQLREQTIAVKLSKKRWGFTKTFTKEQKRRAAQCFGASEEVLSASKKLVDSRHPKVAAVTAVLNATTKDWERMTMPFAEKGIRLIRPADVDPFQRIVTRRQAELDGAMTLLDSYWPEIRRIAEVALVDLWNPQDYPESLAGEFSFRIDYPVVEPDTRLLEISPQLFEQQKQRIAAQYDEALQLGIEAFVDEFSKCVEQLTKKLNNRDLKFYDTDVTHLTDFFGNFRRMNIGGNEQLEEAIQRAQDAVGHKTPNQFRNNSWLRDSVSQQLGDVQTAIEGLMVNRPKRAISLDD
jgi:hypothetical protein